jgi:O-antigen ligase
MNTLPSQLAGLSPLRRRPGIANRVDFLLGPLLGAALLVRVLTDDLSAPDSRHTGSLSLSGAIALMFMLVAGLLLLRRRRGLLPTVLATLWLCIWMAVAVNTHGASTETLREGVREISVVAVFVIVYNARGAVTVPIVTRMVQLIGFAPALLALYQLATNTGMDIEGELRAHGTFAHPNSAAMFFAIATIASLWLYLDNGQRRADALLMTLFTAALIATFSIDGMGTLVAMLIAFGALIPGAFRVKLGPYVIAGLVALAFFATPLGSHRISKESSTSLVTAERGEANSSLAWRLYKWKSLLPEWERAPLFGQGLGTTTTGEGTPLARKPPHDEYIRYLVETGVVGLAILLGALALLIRALVRRRENPGTLDAGTLNAGTLAIVIVAGCLVNSLADNTLLNSPTCYAAVVIVAAVLALPGIEVQRAPAPRGV